MAAPVDNKSARFQAFKLIDELLAKKANLSKLKTAFQQAFDEDPVTFYKQFIKPTAEKELVILPGTGEKGATVRMIFDEEIREND